MNNVKRFPLFLSFVLLLGLVASLPQFALATAQASTRYVSPTGIDNGDCTNAGEPCQTINYARIQSDPADTIQLSAGTFHENVSLFTELSLVGSGAQKTIIDGGQNGNTVQINANGIGYISDLTIQNGEGGVDNNGQVTLANVIIQHNQGASIGGVYNSSTAVLTMTQTTVYSNTASSGAGLTNFGTATISQSTFYDNATNSSSPGGGLYNATGGTMTLENVTISGNVAGSGGGIANSHTLTMQNVTVANNRTITGFGNGISNYGDIEFQNSIVANNPGSKQCEGPGTLTSLGHNLENTNSCAFNQSGDLPSTSVKIHPLGDYGGPTFTHLLRADSPAIDAGDNSACPATDQRGVARPLDGDDVAGAICDIGAVEYDPATDGYEYLFLPLIMR